MASEHLDTQKKIHLHSSHPLNSNTFPIFQSSAFIFNSTKYSADLFMGKGEGHIYSRLGNPTVELYEVLVRDLEGAAGSLAFGSGMGLLIHLFLFFKKWKSFNSRDTLYGCTVSLFEYWAQNLSKKGLGKKIQKWYI